MGIRHKCPNIPYLVFEGQRYREWESKTLISKEAQRHGSYMMFDVHRCRLLSLSCVAVGRSVKTLGLLHRHRPVSWFLCIVLCLCSISVEAPGQSIDSATRFSKAIDLHRCHGPVLPRGIYIFSDYPLHVREQSKADTSFRIFSSFPSTSEPYRESVPLLVV